MSGTGPSDPLERPDVMFRNTSVVAVERDQLGKGHCVVVLRRHAVSYFDASPEEKMALWAAVDEVKAELDRKYSPVGYHVHFDVGEGEHCEVHVVPRFQPNTTQNQTHQATAANEGAQLASGPEAPLGPMLLKDLDGAVRVDIAVAFVFAAGLHAGVLSRLRDMLTRQGSRVRLVTGDYQGVTEPSALLLLLNLKEQVDAGRDLEGSELQGQIELRVFDTEQAGTSFHPKAYLIYSAPDGKALATYIGSSNLSRTALLHGVEWNLRASDEHTGELAKKRFHELFQHPSTKPLTHRWVDEYIKRRPQRDAPGKPPLDVPIVEDAPLEVPQPTSIQREALDALESTREAGNRAGLVVLATGLGKTWLSAFDSTPGRGFERVLFVAHREEILNQAMATFARIQPTASLGLYTGKQKAFESRLLFASVQTLGRGEHLSAFSPTHFDYIVVDEFHHAAAATYRRVLDHFEPKFLLGLTATPERTDGGDLLGLCDENLVFQCGLAPGVRQQLLSPFHYFGVPDMVEYAQIPWRSRRFDEAALTQAVATQERAQNALEQLREHGGQRVLGFCVSQRHADFMREYFQEQTTLRCASVHSGPTSDSRSRALDDLASGELDVLFCVDMFNEGLDVPSIDTVLMLRPTESKVIWLQQLGRGLRKHEGKTHLRVIDYIGNHRSFLEKPAALLAALGVTVTSPQQLTQLLAERSYELPDGCEVTYTLAAQEILAKLCPPSKNAQTLRQWYESFREHAERRPTAREALHAGFDPGDVHRDYGSWLEFVGQMGDLSQQQNEALTLDRQLLVELESRPARRSHELLVLDVMRASDALPGAVTVSDLSLGVARRARRTLALRRDVPVALDNERGLQDWLLQGPLKTLAALQLADGAAFAIQVDQFRTGQGVHGDSGELRGLVAELLEWRLAEYLSRKPSQPVFEVKQNKQGEPRLKLDRTRYELPNDWVLVAADAAPYRAHFGKHWVDAARSADDPSSPNQLGQLLKGWFGEDAGAPGSQQRVVQRIDERGQLVWKPFVPSTIYEDDGKERDARFDCEDFEGEPTIVFHSRGGDRNNDYARGLEVLLSRLAAQRVNIERVVVESGGTRELPLEQRTLSIKDAGYPLKLVAMSDLKGLRVNIGRAAAAVGRQPGAKGGGNNTKRLRIWLSRSVEENALAKGPPPGATKPKTGPKR